MMSDPGCVTGSEGPSLAELIDQIADRMRRGESVDPDQYAAEHPRHAEQLRTLLPTIELFAAGIAVGDDEQLGSGATVSEVSEPAAPPPVFLGDYRILVEVGRGGMGVVYEAEQISLNRRVALKILPFAAILDRRSLQRFENEAKAAAALDHPNIVRIHGVGCDRGVHFYAMQFIEGQTLARIIADLRGPAEAAKRDVAQSPVERPLSHTTVAAPSGPVPVAIEELGAAVETKCGDSTSVSGGPRYPAPAFFRWAAELGIQAAEALEHAAEEQAALLRAHVYAADIRLARGAWEQANLPWAREYLEKCLPRDGAEDLRGFEWHYLWGLCHQEERGVLARRHAPGARLRP